MSEKTKHKPAIPVRILENEKIDPTDVRIMNGLLEEKSKTKVADEVGLNERSIDYHMKKLQDNEIVKKQSVPIVDIFKLYNFVKGVYIKIQLTSSIPLATASDSSMIKIPTIPPGPGWEDVMDVLERSNKQLFKKLVRLAIATGGTETDLFLIITFQSNEEYTSLMDSFRGTGIVVSIRSEDLLPLKNYRFDPIAVPDPDEVEEGWKYVLNRKLYDKKKT